MQKYIGTRIEEETKDKFKEFAKKYQLNESTMLRIIISTLVEKPELFSKILEELHQKAKNKKT